MALKLSPRPLSSAAIIVLLATLLQVQSALAGGCCFREITITSLDAGRQVTISGPTLTTPYDLSTFGSFTDFSTDIPKPSRSGPAYEVARFFDQTAWDHLIYYPGVGDQPGAVFYEGIINGSSEYDHRWFRVPPEQDLALRQALAKQGFKSGAPPQSLALIVSGLLVAGLLLGIASLWVFPLRYSRIRGNAWAARRK